MNKIMIPSILVATVMIAAVFAFIPVEQASTVHDTVQANTQQFSTVSQDTDIDDNDVLITCPATSDGCVINDVIVYDTDAVQDVTIDALTYTANDITGDPTITITGTDQAIGANSAEFVNSISGVAMRAGDTVLIDFTDPGAETNIEVQVTAQIEGGVTNITIGEQAQ